MQQFYRIPFERFEKYAPYGTPQRVAESLSRYGDAGCRLFNLMPIAADADTGIAAVAEIKRLLKRRRFWARPIVKRRRNRFQVLASVRQRLKGFRLAWRTVSNRGRRPCWRRCSPSRLGLGRCGSRDGSAVATLAAFVDGVV